jgi:hypothetical protein
MICNRRNFIKQLLRIGTLTATASIAAPAPSKATKLTTLKVAGLQYGAWASHRFDIDEALTLVREPHNPHDRYAVALYYHGKKAGYIPRTNSRIIASLMDAGEGLEAKVRYFDQECEVYERLWVSVWMGKGRG